VASIASDLPAAALTRVLAIGFGGTTGDAAEPLVMLAGWAVLLAALAARRFRWD
jgi:hypothetical protein